MRYIDFKHLCIMTWSKYRSFFSGIHAQYAEITHGHIRTGSLTEPLDRRWVVDSQRPPSLTVTGNVSCRKCRNVSHGTTTTSWRHWTQMWCGRRRSGLHCVPSSGVLPERVSVNVNPHGENITSWIPIPMQSWEPLLSVDISQRCPLLSLFFKLVDYARMDSWIFSFLPRCM